MVDPLARRPLFAWLPVSLVAGGVAALLLATINRYGYHRDELYFRVLGQHPAWGYIDQPPATPLLTRLSTAVFGDSVWGLRVPAVLCAVAVAYLVALIAREVGGGPGAQIIAACAASGTLVLALGHVLATASVDTPVWLLVILFAFRALLRDEPRWWLAAGATAGVGLYNKHLVILLLLGLAGGLLLAGPRRVLLSRWLWAGAALAVMIGSPNLIYQVTHDFPQLKMAEALRENKGSDSMVLLLPFQLVAIGLPLFPITVAGIVKLFRDQALRPLRAFAAAYFLLVVALFFMAGQPYYTMGVLLALYAIGSVATANWLAGRATRMALIGAAVAVNAAAAAAFTLPVFPLSTQEKIGIASSNQVTRDQIGWPAYVAQVASVYQDLPPDEAARAVLIAGNYGEYGSIARYGADRGLPVDRLYSGQNELRNLGGPPDSADVAIVVGVDDHAALASRFDSCTVEGRLDSGYDIDNEEQDRAIEVCRGPREPWRSLWPRFYHYD
jgi:4-amino-4-deoxy-L-arabinose transferase-like glycosyltransferase